MTGDLLVAICLAAIASGTSILLPALGEALTVAKQEYKGSLALVGAYDEKAMAELTFYGLPMYRIGGSSASNDTLAGSTKLPAAPSGAAPSTSQPQSLIAAGVLGTDPATGLATESLTLDKTFVDATDKVTPTDGRGSYYKGSNGQIVEHWNVVDRLGLLQQLGAV